MRSHNRLTALFVIALLAVCACASAEGFTFVSLSDCHIRENGQFVKNLEGVVADVNASGDKPAFAIVTGDQTELGFGGDIEKYNELMAPLGIPIYNVLGNHEVKWSNWSKAIPEKFWGCKPYYSFDHGGIHFVGLDSTIWFEHHGNIDRSQLDWLKDDLRKIGTKMPVVLFYHACPGFLRDETELLETVEPFNVRLILVGHGHTFKTWKRNGIIFQMTKGAMNDQGGYRIYEVSDTEIKGYTKLTGQDRKPDVTIPLKPIRNPIALISPKVSEKIEGTAVRIRARVPGTYAKIELGIDGETQEVTSDDKGICEATAEWKGNPGWHTAIVRATDADGMVWDDSAVIRIDGADREVWRMRATGALQRPVRVAGDRIYFGACSGDVYCLDARTGKEIWRRDVGSDVVSEVAVSGGLAYLGNAEGRVICLYADTGEPKWDYKTGGPIQGSPVVGDGRVFVGSGDQSFYALDAKTGGFLWKYDMERMTQSLPVYQNGVVFFGAWDTYFHALNAKDGADAWKYKTGQTLYYSPSNSNPATDGTYVAVAATPLKATDPDIYCWDMKTGDVKWKIRSPNDKTYCSFNTPTIVDGKLYISALTGDLYCLSMVDGSKVWQAKIGESTFDNSPVVAGGKVYIGSIEGNLYCFDNVRHEKDWTYSCGIGRGFTTPTLWKDLVIMPDTDGYVTAVKQVPGPPR